MLRTPSTAVPEPAKSTPNQLARLERAREIVRQFVPEGASLLDNRLPSGE